MCTRVLWPSPNGPVIVGRNMDFHRDTGTNLWVLPRGEHRTDGLGGNLSWTATHGSVVAGADDLVSVDGLNEAGLTGNILWLAESDYGDHDPARPALSVAVWLQYFLDNFATVAEAVTWVRDTQVQVVTMADPSSGEPLTVHLAIADKSGDSAIIEYVGGAPTVWHDRDYRVMTNSPPYGQQLELLSAVEGFGGQEHLPGTTLASDRFARAAYYLSRLPDPATNVEAIAGMLSVMRNAAQPFRIPDTGKPDVSQTLWQTVADLTNRRYVFSSTTRPNILWVDLDGLDFSKEAGVRRLDLVTDTALEGGLVGNVTTEFSPHAPMQLMGGS